MKRYLIVCFLLLVVGNSFGQSVDRYCFISYNDERPKHPYITVDLGNLTTFKDSSIVTTVEKVKSLRYIADILNHMTVNGWSLVNVSITSHSDYTKYFTFKRTFDKGEIIIR